ncbi:MAG: Gfo/Idh/MocA family oxidoreductase [Planctomycetaceae bacterium]
MSGESRSGRPLRVGIVGCGRMGRVHAERLVQTGLVEIVAVHDTSASTAAALRHSFAPMASCCDSVEEVLEVPGLAAVVLCSPTGLHYEQALPVLAANLAVLCEKPLADRRDRMDELIAAAERSTAPAVLAYQRRFWGTYRTLRREVASGRWGAIRAVTSHNTERWQQTITGTWRDDPDQNPGGFLGDAGSHKLDAMFYTIGLRPIEVFARSQRRGSRVEIITSVSAVLEGDVALTMDFVGSAQHQSEDLTIHCDEADLMIRDWRVWIARNNEVRPLEPLEPLEPTTDPATGFVAIVAGELANPAPFTVARPVGELTAAILRSADTGKVTYLDEPPTG